MPIMSVVLPPAEKLRASNPSCSRPPRPASYLDRGAFLNTPASFLGNPLLSPAPPIPILPDLLCDVLYGVHEVVHVFVPLGPQVQVEPGIYLPIVRVVAPGNILVLHRDCRV